VNWHAIVTIELHTASHVLSPATEDFIAMLKGFFSYIYLDGEVLVFNTAEPVSREISSLTELHELLSDLGNCTIRATEEGFHVIIED